ncbi:MAG: ribulokinase [Propionibacteriaceae bacterium]|nr:ribulokinase [Propionibacteriaceae bacterium]
MTQASLVAGVDFGTDTVRVCVWDLARPACVLIVSRPYRRWASGAFCVPEQHQFRQHPLDHLEALEAAFAEVASQLGDAAITALAIDATGSTPAPTDEHGVPLALLPGHEDDPDCMFWLWKDHTSSEAAEKVNLALSSHEPDFTTYQGRYSSEWWWAKILHGVTQSEAVRLDAKSWVEHSDWLANLLVGADDVRQFSRNSCAAGHKALYNRRLGGMVPEAVLDDLHPHLAEVARTFRTPPDPAGTPIGTLTVEWADRLHLSPETVVAVGSLDAHAGAVGAGIAPGTLVKVVGTSTVDMFLTDYATIEGRDTRAICGLAEDSIVPGHLGGEAGQAAFGDLFAWYTRVLTWPWEGVLREQLAGALPASVVDGILAASRDALLPALEKEASARGPAGIVALDWINGRRYPDLDDQARAALLNLRIGHDAVDIYRALMQAAIMGSKAIFAGLSQTGAEIRRVILVGGVVRNSKLVCEALADGLGTEVMVSRVDEVCATGAAIYAAVAAGAFNSIPAAQEALCEPYRADFTPSPVGMAEFDRTYQEYRRAGTWSARHQPAPLLGEPG